MKKRNMMKDFKKIIALAIVFLCTHSQSALVEGSLDASFNGSGLSTLLDSDSTIKAVAIQADGKIVAVGSSDSSNIYKNTFLVARFNTNGSLDTSFGCNGKVLTRFGAAESASSAHAVVIQEDGKIVVAGFTDAVRSSARWCLARYNPDGSLDQSFYGGRAIFKGTVITFFGNDAISQANALALAADGKIIAAGMSQVQGDKTYFALARYNPNGSLDEAEFNPEGKGALAGTVRTTFGGAIDNDQAFAVAIQPNGKIVAGGSSMLTGIKTFALARYNPDGSLDKSFFAPGFARYHGTVVTNFACGESQGVIHALVLQPDGKIVAGGSTNSNAWRPDVSRFALARYDNRGILDEKFGGYGLATTPGTLISTFGAGEGNSRVNALALQGDGKILAAGMVSMGGQSHWALARYDEEGHVDCSFNDGDCPAGKVITSLGGRKANEIFGLALDHEGRVIAAGSTDMHGRPQGLMARYLTNDLLTEPTIISPCNNSVIVNGSAVELKGISQNPSLLKIFVNDALVGTKVAKGTSGTWRYQLPPLASGNYTLKILELYAGGNVSLASQPTTIIIDQHPKPVNATINTCGLNPVSGLLQAQGASGEYSFSIESVVNGTVTLNGAEYVFYPLIASGQGSFTFKAVDSITACCATGTVKVIINEIPGAMAAQFNTCQNSSYKGSVASYISGGNPPFSFAQLGANNGTLALNPDGTFNFMPQEGFNGTTSFQYQVTDAKGCVSEPLTAQITVYEAPRVINASFTTHEAETLSNNLNNLVSGGTAAYRFTLVECPGNCAITLQHNGSFTMIPTVGFSGNLAFKYQVTDAHECTSNVATINVTVFEAPVASNSTMSICQNGQLSQTLHSLVNKGAPAYSYTQIANAAHATVIVNSDGSFTLKPDTDFVGNASFTYQVTDANNSMSNIATVTVIVNPLPKAIDTMFATCQDIILNATLAAGSNSVSDYAFTLFGPSSNGAVTMHDDGSFEFVPNEGFSGVTAFQYTITDANGCTSLPANVMIFVWQKPTVKNDAFQTCSNRPTPNSFINFASGGKAPYSYIIDHVENGSAHVASDGSYLFTSDNNFAGTATITYHASDVNHCNSDPGVVTITVYPSPTVADATNSTLENAPLDASVASLASGGIAPYSFSIVGEPVNGTVSMNADGSYEFMPDADYHGPASFEYQMTDVHGCVSNPGKVEITVFQLPKLQDHAAVSLMNNEVTGSLLDLISVGAAPFIFQIVTHPDHGNLVIHDGLYVYTPEAGFVGNDSFQVRVTDAHQGSSNIATFSLSIHSPIQIVEAASYGACQDTAINADLRRHVASGVPPYTFSLVSQAHHGTAEIHSNGSFTYTPNAGASGIDSFTYEVVDSIGLSKVTSTVEISMYAKPHVEDAQLSTFENLPLEGSLQAFASGGKQEYQFIQVDSSNNGSVILNADGSFTFTPMHNFVGAASFMYSIIDANNCTSASATVTISVLQLPKVFNSEFNAVTDTITHGSLISQISGGLPPYTFQEVTEPLHGILILNADGSYNYAPHSDYEGADSFQYMVMDDNGGASNLATVSITIYKAVSSTQQKQYSACPNTMISGSLGDSVANGLPPYNFAVANAPMHGTLELASDGSFTYVPAVDFSGSDSFEYVVHDALNSHVHATAAITIFDAPDAHDATYAIFESEKVHNTIVSAISGGQQPYTVTLIGQAQNGTVQLEADGTFEFIPTAGFIGNGSFQYQVTDAHQCMSSSATVTIQILPLPKAHNGSTQGLSNTAIVGSLEPLVTDGTAAYTFQIVTHPLHGSITLNDASYVYLPQENYAGTDSFEFVAIDSNHGASNTATVSIAVYHEVAVSHVKSYTACPNNTISGSLQDVVMNGLAPYTYSLAQAPDHGSVIITPDGTFTYVPEAGFNGLDKFAYMVIDTLNSHVTGTVNITIYDAPAAQDIHWTIFESEAVRDSVAPHITGGKQPYLVRLVATANHGAFHLNDDGSFEFIPAAGFIGDAIFQYAVTDANGCMSSFATATITVLPLPKANDSNLFAVTHANTTGSLASLASSGTPPYTFEKLTDANHGTVIVNQDGSYSYTSDVDYTGNDSFSYAVIDAHHAKATGQINIVIVQPPVITGQHVYRTCQNTPISGDLSSSIAQGIAPYQFALVNNASNGNAIVTANGAFNYLPAQGFNGSDAFIFKVTDAMGTQVQGTVTISVNQSPIVQDKTWNVQAAQLADSLLPLVSGGNPGYTFSAVANAQNGALTLNADGTFVLTSAAESMSVASFTYQVTDSSNCMSNIGTVTVEFNPPPALRAAPFTTVQDQPLSSSLAPLMIGGNPPFIFNQIGIAKNGHVTLSRNGSFIFTPSPEFVGEASFNVIATDKNGMSSAVTPIAITILEDTTKRSRNLQQSNVVKRYLNGRNK